MAMLPIAESRGSAGILTEPPTLSLRPSWNGACRRDRCFKKAWAKAFAREWIESWNSHDLGRILSHYADDLEMSSPLVVDRFGRADGVLKGKSRVREYWQPSMSLQPPLGFELIDVLVGIDQLTIYYRNVGRRVVAETLTFNSSLQAVRGCSQWSALEA